MKIAFRMKCYENEFNEYVKAHKNVDKQLELEFEKAKVEEYTIWYDEDTSYLFAFVKLENFDHWKKIDDTMACKKWWKKMEPLMVTNSDGSPLVKNLSKVYDYKGE